MIFKFCPRCNTKIEYNKERYCNECKAFYEEQKRINDRTSKERYKRYKDRRTDYREQSFYNSPAWARIREKVMLRDLNICQFCLMKEIFEVGDLIHHVIELKEDFDLRIDERNLITLCSKCHRDIHFEYLKGDKERKELQENLKKIIDEKYKDFEKFVDF